MILTYMLYSFKVVYASKCMTTVGIRNRKENIKELYLLDKHGQGIGKIKQVLQNGREHGMENSH